MLPWEVTQVLAPERESPVALNMVIAQDTEYVLLDEPTNDLDIHHAANLMKTVRRLCDELSKTVILVLHEDQLGRLLLRLHLRSSGRQGRQVRHCGGGNDQRNPVGALPGGLQDHDHRGPASVHLLLKPPSFQYFCRKRGRPGGRHGLWPRRDLHWGLAGRQLRRPQPDRPGGLSGHRQ